MNWGEFFAMGGYGDYVWSAYLVVAATLIANIVVPLRSRTAVLRRLRALDDRPLSARSERQARTAPAPTRPRGTNRRTKSKMVRKGK